jgi:hypothetical protein
VRTYTNPVYADYFADPFVLATDDGYVAIGTGRMVDGRAFEVLRSDDLVSWRSVGGALEVPDGLGTDYWAPEVAHVDGRWWMYYSVGVGDVGHHLRVAVADEPTGPYVDQGVDLTPHERFAIDPHPFVDADGTRYLPMLVQPLLVLEASGDQLQTVRRRGAERGVPMAIYTAELFATGRDEDNRAAVRAVATEQLDLVGIGLRAPHRDANAILRGLRRHG